MATIVNSKRFIPMSRLPVQPLWISGSQACALMSAANVGALVAEDGGRPAYLISGAFLRVAISTAAQQIGLPAATIIPLSLHLTAYWNPDHPLAQAVLQQFQADGRSPEQAVATIANTSLAMEGPEPQERAFSLAGVRGSAGVAAGWYIGFEGLMEVIQTPPPAWYCEPHNHKNGDPDTGKCHSCGGKLKP